MVNGPLWQNKREWKESKSCVKPSVSANFNDNIWANNEEENEDPRGELTFDQAKTFYDAVKKYCIKKPQIHASLITMLRLYEETPYSPIILAVEVRDLFADAPEVREAFKICLPIDQQDVMDLPVVDASQKVKGESVSRPPLRDIYREKVVTQFGAESHLSKRFMALYRANELKRSTTGKFKSDVMLLFSRTPEFMWELAAAHCVQGEQQQPPVVVQRETEAATPTAVATSATIASVPAPLLTDQKFLGCEAIPIVASVQPEVAAPPLGMGGPLCVKATAAPRNAVAQYQRVVDALSVEEAHAALHKRFAALLAMFNSYKITAAQLRSKVEALFMGDQRLLELFAQCSNPVPQRTTLAQKVTEDTSRPTVIVPLPQTIDGSVGSCVLPAVSLKRKRRPRHSSASSAGLEEGECSEGHSGSESENSSDDSSVRSGSERLQAVTTTGPAPHPLSAEEVGDRPVLAVAVGTGSDISDLDSDGGDDGQVDNLSEAAASMRLSDSSLTSDGGGDEDGDGEGGGGSDMDTGSLSTTERLLQSGESVVNSAVPSPAVSVVSAVTSDAVLSVQDFAASSVRPSSTPQRRRRQSRQWRWSAPSNSSASEAGPAVAPREFTMAPITYGARNLRSRGKHKKALARKSDQPAARAVSSTAGRGGVTAHIQAAAVGAARTEDSNDHMDSRPPSDSCGKMQYKTVSARCTSGSPSALRPSVPADHQAVSRAAERDRAQALLRICVQDSESLLEQYDALQSRTNITNTKHDQVVQAAPGLLEDAHALFLGHPHLLRQFIAANPAVEAVDRYRKSAVTDKECDSVIRID